MKKTVLIVVSLFICFMSPLFLSHHSAWASAGGGVPGYGGGGSGGGTSPGSGTDGEHLTKKETHIQFFIIGIGAAIFLALFLKEINRLPLLSKRIENKSKGLSPEENDFWNEKQLRKRVDSCYLHIQKAWSNQDPEEASVYMSERLLEEHKKLIDDMKNKKIQNIVSRVHVVRVKAIYVSPDRQEMRVSMIARMIDYTINIETQKLLSGSKYRKGILEERWFFIKRNGQWVADQIYS